MGLIWSYLVVSVYRRLAEQAEAGAGDVVDEIDELRRSFTARLRSESLQRQSDNLEKDSKIERLETILELQLRREMAKDRKIAELEEKVEAMVQSKEMQHRGQTVELHKEWASLLSKDDRDAVVEPDVERGRNNGAENESRFQDSTVQAATPCPLSWETEDELGSTNVKDETRHFEELEEDCRPKEAPVHGQRLPAKKKTSGRRKLSCLMKRKPSQTEIT